MHTPIRFRDGGDALERELLASVDSDQAPNESRARVALQLGLVGLASSINPASLDAAPASPSVAAASPALARGSGWLHGSLLKKVLLVGAATTVAIVAGLWLRAPALPEASAPAPVAPTVLAPRATATQPSPEPHAQPTQAAPPLAPTPRSASRTTRHKAQTPLSVQSNRLLAEVAQLDRVRAALRAEQGASALSQLAAYDATFPGGELALEAAVLRVQALLASGDPSAASALARRTLERPGSERYRTELQRALAAAR